MTDNNGGLVLDEVAVVGRGAQWLGCPLPLLLATVA